MNELETNFVESTNKNRNKKINPDFKKFSKVFSKTKNI